MVQSQVEGSTCGLDLGLQMIEEKLLVVDIQDVGGQSELSSVQWLYGLGGGLLGFGESVDVSNDFLFFLIVRQDTDRDLIEAVQNR